MATFGGTARFTYNGTPITTRGHVKVTPSNVKADEIPNGDGTISRSMKVTGYMAEIKFEDSSPGTANPAKPPDWDGILKGGPYNITIVEDLTGVTHMFTNANFVGQPSSDRETGEVDGLKIVADQYSFKGN